MTPNQGVRCPVGRLDLKDPFRSDDRPLFVAQLAEATAKLRAAVAGLSDNQLDTPYRLGGWTVRQVVHHLADARTDPVEPSLQMFEEVCARWCGFLESLAPGDWLRSFTNPEWGMLTVEDAIRANAWHSQHHTAHITELRKRMDW
jgi:hypothetical protein